MSMLMNGSSSINYGNALRRRPIPDGSATSGKTEVNVGDIDVDALLAETEEARLERQWTESYKEKAAKQALNALQQWLFGHDSSTSTEDRKRWRLAYNVMTRLSGNSGELPDQMVINQLYFNSSDSVGRGAFADVFKGEFNGLPVAIKRLVFGDAQGSNADLRRRFIREALIWFQLRHPNIVELQGIYLQSANLDRYPCMVSFWADGGTIVEYINSAAYEPERERKPLLTDVAQGLIYVHERGVAHGDIHQANILVHQGHALLTDFGLTIVGDKSHSAIPTTKLPAQAIRWIAPEFLSGDDYIPRKTLEGDMFSFGRLCLAICTRGVIYGRLHNMGVASKLLKGEQPTRPLPEECDRVPMSDQLWALAMDCWKVDTGNRPSATEALQRL